MKLKLYLDDYNYSIIKKIIFFIIGLILVCFTLGLMVLFVNYFFKREIYLNFKKIYKFIKKYNWYGEINYYNNDNTVRMIMINIEKNYKAHIFYEKIDENWKLYYSSLTRNNLEIIIHSDCNSDILCKILYKKILKQIGKVIG